VRACSRLLVVLVVALVAAPAAFAEPARVGFPSSMASTGDSITRAFNTGFLPFLDWPSNSWSTGSSGTVGSHYRRILAGNPAISGRNSNFAVSGADMADLDGQAANAVASGAQYVTILMGANDVCASSEAAMTDPAVFRAQLDAGLRRLSTGLPDSRLYVVSIPDIYNLWAVLRGNSTARLIWGLAGICQSMLARPSSTAQADVDRRNRVRQRNIAYNAHLQAACAQYIHCRFDGNAVFGTAFTASDVSTRDYFHPSVAGQTKLAAGSWAAGFNFGDVAAPVSTASTARTSTGALLVTLSATDNAGVSGLEYRLGSGAWVRYAAAVTVPAGTSITWRAVDVNGNLEATKTLVS
jgi:lysophospholipase L1-like esterase